MRVYLAGLTISLFGACATPGIDYSARVPAESYAASEYRNVSVEGFRGPGGYAFTRRFAAMLDNVTFDGSPWFQTSISYGANQEKTGFYTGSVNVDYYDEDEYYRTVKKCVEWDGLFDCEHRAEVEQMCIDTRVDVSVNTELIDHATSRSVYQSRHSGSASDRDCYDVKSFANHHGHSYSRFSISSASGYRDAPDHLIREALTDTLYAIRREIAPANIRAKATIVTEAIDPEARADPRFQQAVEATKDGNIQIACDTWRGLSNAFPNAPGVTHNMGACAEALGDFPGAQTLYAKAAEQSGSQSEVILKALNRISTRRVDNGILAELAGETQLPVVTPGS